MRVVVATSNRGKLIELRHLLEGTGLELVGIDQAGVSLPEIDETGSTYLANARLKAYGIASHLGGQVAVLADDSGLEVDALGGAPGVHSARYAGDRGAAANRAKLLGELGDRADRAARFRCVLVLVRPGLAEVTAEGTSEGSIARAERGGGGFGYDPLFDVAPHELAALGRTGPLTLAELTDDEKNTISHRGRAVRELRARLLG